MTRFAATSSTRPLSPSKIIQYDMARVLFRPFSCFALVLGALLLHVRPAAAFQGTIYAVVSLTNETPNPVTLSGSVSGDWNDPGAQGDGTLDVGNPNGLVLPPGQTVVWGSVRHNGFLGTNGTGGSVSFSLGTETGTVTWSSPWDFFNGLFSSGCGGGPSKSSGPSTFQSPVSIIGGASSSGNDTCVFTYGLVQPTGILQSGRALVRGQAAMSVDGRFRLIMQDDGNLVMYFGTTALWGAGTFGTAAWIAVMQTDGNLVIYDNNMHALWASNEVSYFQYTEGASLSIQNDGNLVIYGNAAGSQVNWTAGCCCACGTPNWITC
ncbi:MAG TPA: hypothetical protein VGM06_16330 [Polyangiaceae bacterium]|jgi:hypothetical protein